jgi:hypothetical protein
VLHLRLIIFSVGGDVPVDSDTLLMTDFVNLKIKPAQFFGGAHRGRIYVRVFIEVSACTYMNICVRTVFLKKQINDTKGLVFLYEEVLLLNGFSKFGRRPVE